MHLRLRSTAHVSLFRIIPAFPLLVLAEHGRARIRTHGFERVLLPGHRTALPPFQSLELHLDGSARFPTTCSLVVSTRAHSHSSLRGLIAQQAFVEPKLSTIQRFANTLMMSPSEIRRTLFSEGAAMTELCRTQRLMRALFEVAKGSVTNSELKRTIGWGVQSDLESAFHDWFGICLSSARCLAAVAALDQFDRLHSASASGMQPPFT